MERVALEFVFVLELIFSLFEFTEPLWRMVLAQPRANGRVDRTHVDRAQQHGHLDKLGPLHIAGRLWCDRSCGVGRWPRRDLSPTC